MKYEFTIQKYVFMYNHVITCTFGTERISAICESAPSHVNTILFWPDDFGFSAIQTKDLIEDLKDWAKEQGITCIIRSGNR